MNTNYNNLGVIQLYDSLMARLSGSASAFASTILVSHKKYFISLIKWNIFHKVIHFNFLTYDLAFINKPIAQSLFGMHDVITQVVVKGAPAES